MRQMSFRKQKYRMTAGITRHKRNHAKIIAFVVIGSALLSGCSGIGVKPWQRGTLAKPGMQLIDDGLESAYDDHIYFSKEASSGGKGFGGGGCGCN